MEAEGYAKFRNDRGVPEIRIGVREFECIGASPPHDHPHIYLEMGGNETLLCLYCATSFRFDAGLGPDEADPSDCLYLDDAEPQVSPSCS
jgi:uncharacterized Zn-finger protein